MAIPLARADLRGAAMRSIRFVPLLLVFVIVIVIVILSALVSVRSLLSDIELSWLG